MITAVNANQVVEHFVVENEIRSKLSNFQGVYVEKGKPFGMR